MSTHPVDLPGMKRKEFKTCHHCKRGISHTRSPIFYTIQFQQWCLDAAAIQRTAGLEQFFGGGTGGAVLANVMGTDPDLAKRTSDSGPHFLCSECVAEHQLPLIYLEERE